MFSRASMLLLESIYVSVRLVLDVPDMEGLVLLAKQPLALLDVDEPDWLLPLLFTLAALKKFSSSSVSIT